MKSDCVSIFLLRNLLYLNNAITTLTDRICDQTKDVDEEIKKVKEVFNNSFN